MEWIQDNLPHLGTWAMLLGIYAKHIKREAEQEMRLKMYGERLDKGDEKFDKLIGKIDYIRDDQNRHFKEIEGRISAVEAKVDRRNGGNVH